MLHCLDIGAISIHAPLTGSDMSPQHRSRRIYNFNPRSPYGERHVVITNKNGGFYFNPRSPYGERPLSILAFSQKFYFNPRSPYGERHALQNQQKQAFGFQSTLPLRGATRKKQAAIDICVISIHAPLTGSDVYTMSVRQGGENFNPRSPYGERLAVPDNRSRTGGFQSTLPLRGATILS